MNEPFHPEVAILNGALELPSAERSGYLDKACSDNPVLRKHVEELIQANERAENFLEAPLTELNLTVSRKTLQLAEKPGDRIGHYKLLQQIGEGGCGIVYMAEQEEPVRRRVALKIIKLGMDTKQVIARFEAERQALALMDHPNIAKVLDAGATETGRSYFVMELVRGIKITDYCDQNNLGTKERLELFVQICRAIQHAHQKGIIHRDIKPSNMLVTVNDAVAVPKVIDFGIAKATQGRLTDQTLFTAFEQFLGTPAYMSPEQAVMTSLDIDTRSDIYSLGVLLYELLTGHTPFDQKALLASGLEEMCRTIREKEPMRPSTRLTQDLAAALTSRSADFQSAGLPISNSQVQENSSADGDYNSPQAGRPAIQQIGNLRYKDLIGALRGDLDWIVMKCLEKDRARRYETANGLAADIQRHLKHEPVVARPPTALYQFRKLVRRNKLAFAALGAVAIAAASALVILIMSNVRIAGARLAEQVQRQKADLANRNLNETVRLLELQRAEDFFRGDNAGIGVAHLASLLRRDPSNHIAANRLVSALVHGKWVLPAVPPMRHSDCVATVCFSPDNQHVLSASWDRTAQIWDSMTGKSTVVLHHADQVYSAMYSRDGSRVLTASADGTARLWNASNGVAVMPALKHSGAVFPAEFSPDNQFIVTGCADGRARVWDATNGDLKQEFRHPARILLAKFSPDGSLVAAVDESFAVQVWSRQLGQSIFQVSSTSRIMALEFSPNGERLAVARRDGSGQLYATATWKAVGSPLAHADGIWHAKFSADSHLLLTCSQDGTARFWDATTGSRVGPILSHEGRVSFGQFTSDGVRVITTSMDNSARLWDVASGRMLCQQLWEPEQIDYAAFSADERRLATSGVDGVIQLWDIRQRTSAGVNAGFSRSAASATFSPAGDIVVTGSADGTARFMDANTGQESAKPLLHEAPVTDAEFSPNGKLVATASKDGKAFVWDAATSRVIAGPLPHAKSIYTVRFDYKGNRLVTASVDGTARLWDANTGTQLTKPMIHSNEVNLAQFSPDDRFIATASDDHTARVWDASTGKAFGQPLFHSDLVRWVEFSPDSKRLVTASMDNTACIWNVLTSQPVAPRLQHTRDVRMAVFSPDGRCVATASDDQTVRIWDAATGQGLTQPLKHSAPLSRVCFSPDGRRVLTGDWNGKARLWDSSTGLPLTEWLEANGRIMGARFDRSGNRIVLAANNVVIRNLPPAPMPVPDWLAGFAEAMAGIRVTVRGSVETVPREELLGMIRRFSASGRSEFYESTAHWFVTDPAKRPPEPWIRSEAVSTAKF